MIEAGQTLPDIPLTLVGEEAPEQTTPAELFAGKRTVLFAVPGAFTPTCSARHLPGFVEKADELKAKGIDQIACISVNDFFVMRAWADSAGVGDKVTMIADGNAAFAAALGLDMDASRFGMGNRSQRYAMVIDDNKCEALYLEEAGSFEVSSAEHVLSKL